MGLSKAVVKNRVLILLIALILLVPAVFGMLGTRINYDMLDYLPSDMDTVIGQETLKEDFGKGAFSFIVVQDMPVQEVAQLKEKIQQVDHVESVLWYDSVADLSIPMELLPDKLYNEFNTDDATMLAVFFDSATSEDVTMDAIRGDPLHRRQAVLRVGYVGAGDGPEGPVRAGGAYLCGAGRGLCLRRHDAAAGRLAGSIRVSGQHWHGHRV